MAIAGDDVPTVQGIPGECIELLAGGDAAKLVLDVDQPAQAFLVRQPVQRTGQPVQRRGEGQVRIRKRRADQVHGMSRNVARLVIAVQDEIQAGQLCIALLILDLHHA